jgi:hypothetical protein
MTSFQRVTACNNNLAAIHNHYGMAKNRKIGVRRQVIFSIAIT